MESVREISAREGPQPLQEELWRQEERQWRRNQEEVNATWRRKMEEEEAKWRREDAKWRRNQEEVNATWRRKMEEEEAKWRGEDAKWRRNQEEADAKWRKKREEEEAKWRQEEREWRRQIAGGKSTVRPLVAKEKQKELSHQRTFGYFLVRFFSFFSTRHSELDSPPPYSQIIIGRDTNNHFAGRINPNGSAVLFAGHK
jgi:hypothetical protein